MDIQCHETDHKFSSQLVITKSGIEPVKEIFLLTVGQLGGWG